jgi:hypothetical protein
MDTYEKIVKSFRSNAKKLEEKVETLEEEISGCGFHGLKKKIKNTNNQGVFSYFQHSKPRNIYNYIRYFFLCLNKLLQLIDLQVMNVVIGPKSENLDDFNLVITDKTKMYQEVKKFLFAKDSTYLSHKNYEKLLAITEIEAPTLYRLLKYKKELDSKCKIVQVGNCFFFDVRKIILMVLFNFLDKNSNFNDLFKLKISCDSTNVGRVTKLTNITFTIINDKANCMAAKGNFTLAILYGKDDYKNLKEPFEHLMNILNELKEFSYKEKTYNIKYFLGGDWVAMANLLGLKMANGKYPCLWCTKHKDEFGKLNAKFLSRNKKLQCECLLKKKEVDKLGYQNESCVGDIENYDCVIDTLHLFLRISDFLVEELLRILGAGEGYSRDKFEILRTSVTDKNDLKEKAFPCLETLIMFLQNECKISVQLTQEKIIAGLRGPEKKRLFEMIEKIGLKTIFTNQNLKVKNIDKIEKLWKDFYGIYKYITSQNEPDYITVKKETFEWFLLLKSTFAQERITPYIHSFVDHVWEFIMIHKNIHLFNQEGTNIAFLILIYLFGNNTIFFLIFNRPRKTKRYNDQ